MDPVQPNPAASLAPPPASSQPPAPESNLWSGRTSWKHYCLRIALWVMINIVVDVLIVQWAWASEKLGTAGLFWVSVGVLVISAFSMLLKVALHILGRRYRLTTQRLFIESGILSKTIDQTELIRVDDVRVHKSLFDRIFNLGTISLLSTDVTDKELTIEGVSDPDAIAEKVRANMRAQRSKALYVENL